MWIFDSKSRMIIASEIGDCDGNAMRMFSDATGLTDGKKH